MRRDTRLSTTLHALLHMADAGGVLTSAALAEQLQINPVVVRRTMAGLRQNGIVRATKGHGGGWSLARGLDEVTLGDIYDALGMTSIFALGPRTESPRCLLEQAVNRAVGDALEAAELVLVERLRAVTVAALAADARRLGPIDHGARKRPCKGAKKTHG